MKTLVLILSFITAFAGVPLNAQNSFTSGDNNPLIFEKIQNNMRVPQSMKGAVASEQVRVLFTIDEKGKAHVVDVASQRPEIHASVIKQFEAIDFSDSPDNGVNQYSIMLTFTVL